MNQLAQVPQGEKNMSMINEYYLSIILNSNIKN